MSWLYPQALWLLALLPVVWLVAYGSRYEHTVTRLAGGVVLRSAVMVLLVLAIAQPRLLQRDRAVSVVYAIDISRSVAPAAVARALDWIRAADARFQPWQARYLVFADRARYVASPDEVPALSVSREERSESRDTLAQGATDIEQALSAAVAGFAPRGERRLVLITDGIQTRGDLWHMLPRLQAAQVRVFVVPAAASAERDAWVDAIVVPGGVRRQQPVTVRVAVHALDSMPAQVELTARGRRLGTRTVRLDAGANDVAFEVTLPHAGETTLAARVSAQGDRYAANDRLEQSIWVGQRPRVLYVEGVPESGHHLVQALRAHHIEVTPTSADAVAARGLSLAGFDAVILSDVFAQTLDARSAARLEAFVRDGGGGLIFAAGESTYGESGFSGSAVERMLPVRFEGKRKQRDLDLVLLIDRSHSMRAGKLERAKTAALSTLDLLEPRHRLAVVAFDVKAHEVVPLAPVGNKRRAEDLIASMTARGQTSIYPAFVEAQRQLKDSTAATKHVILLSDGVTVQPPAPGAGPSAAEIQAMIQKGREDAMRRDGVQPPKPEVPEPIPEPGAIEALVAELAKANVTVSTIAIGDKPNVALMRDLAAIGQGRSYVARSDGEIPGLFVSETRRLLGESIIEKAFRPVVAHRTAVLDGLDFAGGPPLQGMVVARTKAFADTVLMGPERRPLLVTTHYGLGKTIAFLSDAKDRWSGEWLGWEGYGRLWAQMVRDCIARQDERDLQLRAVRSGSDALVELRAVAADGAYRNGLSPALRVTDPAGRQAMTVLQQVAPGQYARRWAIEAGHAEPYRFELVEGGGLSGTDVRQIGVQALSYSWSDELRRLPPDTATLVELSRATGGAMRPKDADIFALRGDAPRIPAPLWPYLLAAALGLFLLDILWRRAPLPRWRRAVKVAGIEP
jgi:Mg-chelatase subunit ChlD